MERVTLEEELFAEDTEDLDGTIYVVRDGETVFYVGRTTRGICYRLWEHIRSWGDDLGEFIMANVPECLNWTVEGWTVDDCLPYMFQNVSNQDTIDILRWANRMTEKEAERVMIARFKPCLNRMLHTYESKIPDKYRIPQPDIATLREMVDKYGQRPDKKGTTQDDK